MFDIDDNSGGPGLYGNLPRRVFSMNVVFRSGASSKYFFFQAEDGIRDLVRSRGLGDVYKRQRQCFRIQDDDAECRVSHRISSA